MLCSCPMNILCYSTPSFPNTLPLMNSLLTLSSDFPASLNQTPPNRPTLIISSKPSPISMTLFPNEVLF